MIKRMTPKLAAFAALTTAFTVTAYAQQGPMRVSTGVHLHAGACVSCDLSDRPMSGMTFDNATMTGSVFDRANLSGGKIIGSDLSKTQFRKAFMARVTGEGVNMADAKMADVTMTEARFTRSVLTKSDLRRADLNRAHFIGSNFDGADMTGVQAAEAQFTGSHFVKTDLNYANLTGAVLDKAVFQNADFTGAQLGGASFIGADLSGADMSSVKGLTQKQVDQACGNAQTQLPVGFAVSYCKETLTAANHAPASRAHLQPHEARAARRIGRAIARVENLIAVTPRAEAEYRRELQRLHNDLMSARRDIER